MSYTPVHNEPKYNGVYLGQLIDKPVYAAETTKALNGAGKLYKTFKKGEFIGTLWSWSTVDNIPVLMFYADSYFTVPFYVPLVAKTNTPAAADVIKAEAEAGKTMLEKYIDKYAPWVVGGIVVAIAFPTVLNSVTGRNRKIGAMPKNNGVAVAAAAALFLLAFRKPKSKNKVIVSAVEDTTDWTNTEGMVKSQVLPKYAQPVLYSSYDSIMNGQGKYKKPPTFC